MMYDKNRLQFLLGGKQTDEGQMQLILNYSIKHFPTQA